MMSLNNSMIGHFRYIEEREEIKFVNGLRLRVRENLSLNTIHNSKLYINVRY